MASVQVPKHTKQWTVGEGKDFDSLKYDQQAPIPELNANEVLVKLHAASLNYRDLMTAKGLNPVAACASCVPGSDGAGEVVAVGSKVTRFKTGDKVLSVFNQAHTGLGTPETMTSTLGGGNVDGVLRGYGAFPEHGLVSMPPSLSYEEGATLPCAALTAWNALYGLRRLQSGETVLTEGTSGVSLFGIQFAKAAGARVIATTSSSAKAERLRQLGVDHVINYKEVVNWGAEAKKLTPNGEGVDHILEVGGPATFRQAMDAVKVEGIVSVIGYLGGLKAEDEPSPLDALLKNCIIRGILIGNRAQFEEMNRTIEYHKIKPVIDEKNFTFEELKEAYQYQWDQHNYGKVVIKID